MSADLATVISQDESITTFPTRQTPEGRLQLALGVAKGVQAIHEMEGGPIIHADIVSTQFLVDKEGNTKLNDFNRCRFIAHKNTTGEACQVRIPSAPGSSRSPEEYAYVPLTEKMDIYSTGNVLYEILTGVEPWLSIPIAEAQKNVLHGEKPPIAQQYLTPNTADAGLAALIEKTLALDPRDRIRRNHTC
jgi:serine/threonine protein kinase